MFAVDTNVFVYAALENTPEHERCARLLGKWLNQDERWYTTWNVLYEFLRVATHRVTLANPWSSEQAWDFVDSLLDSPGLKVLEHTFNHGRVAAKTLAELPDLRGNVMHDLHTAVLLREHGVRRIYTRDADFRRFPFLEVIDPLET